MADARGTTLSLRIAGTGEESSGDRRWCSPPAGARITFAGFLKAYVETVDEQVGGEADDAESRLPQSHRGPAAGRRRAHPRRPRHQPAGPLHRGVADQGARGAGHRPPVDLLVDHQDHPGPRLRAQEGQRTGAVLGGVRRNRFAGAAFRPARRLRLHRGDGRRARRDRLRATSNAPTGSTTSTSAATTASPTRWPAPAVSRSLSASTSRASMLEKSTPSSYLMTPKVVSSMSGSARTGPTWNAR